MTRVSPPELARELPGPHASTRVTRARRRSTWSAVQPPDVAFHGWDERHAREAIAHAGQPDELPEVARAERFHERDLEVRERRPHADQRRPRAHGERVTQEAVLTRDQQLVGVIAHEP